MFILILRQQINFCISLDEHILKPRVVATNTAICMVLEVFLQNLLGFLSVLFASEIHE